MVQYLYRMKTSTTEYVQLSNTDIFNFLSKFRKWYNNAAQIQIDHYVEIKIRGYLDGKQCESKEAGETADY